MEERATQHPIEQHAPNGQPPTPPAPYGQPWPPPYGPPPKRGPAWLMPVAIVVAALLIAGAVVAFAILSNKSGGAPAGGGNQPSASAAAPTSAVNDEDSSTCRAWRSTKSALDNADNPLPDGWDWNTPGIDALIAKSNAVVTNAMNLFEPQIAAQPADLAAAAHAYVKGRRTEVSKLADHTYTEADGVPANAALSTLDQLCHVAG
jgi:hypothetical protein